MCPREFTGEQGEPRAQTIPSQDDSGYTRGLSVVGRDSSDQLCLDGSGMASQRR